MKTRDRILAFIREKRSVSGKLIVEHLGITRQAVNKHVLELLKAGLITKSGSTRGARYHITGERPGAVRPKPLRRTYRLSGIAEDEVFAELALLAGLKRNLAANAYEIFRYAFTEILNNAIDHSFSEAGDILVSVGYREASFTIRDFGIGIFNSIAEKFSLGDEEKALGELLKGKKTTLPARHSGEGIFFTSKCGDRVAIRSHKISLVFDNLAQDVRVEEKRSLEGTEVGFSIGKRSRKKLTDIFREYAPEEYEYRFEKTRVYVQLFQRDYISRSEARRMLAGLEAFREVVLDFKGVKSIGQAFADEVFRVFTRGHPDISIKTENVRPAIRTMIDHVS
jgi:biotin operon repressor/anti-sigma regulatory factor (Ser/Thr protein kinase)